MTLSQILAADIEYAIPSLVRSTAVVALVPATELRGWAAEMAWLIARAAANAGRRTALVDCFVDAPTLHNVSGAGNEEGLVDAFEYGASLNRIVQQQPQANLYFIPAGTFAPDAEQLMQNPRWRRLSAGFRHEEALLLLYVGAEHLAGLAAEPDGIIVLAPQGLDLAVTDAPSLTEAVGRGMPLLGVVADEQAVARVSGQHTRPAEPLPFTFDDDPLDTALSEDLAAPAAAEPAPAEPARRARPSAPVAARGERASAPFAMLTANQPQSSRWGIWVAVFLVAALAAAAWWYFQIRPRMAPAAAAPVPAGDAAPAAAVPVPPAAESLPFAVQVAALPRLRDALAFADSLTAHGTPALVAPVRLGGRRVFYRVHAGPYATRAAADSVLGALRAAGTLAPNAGLADSVPLSVALGAGLSREAAEAERTRLRTAGVPAFILGQADGTFRVYAGAYAATAQATLLQDLLTPTGSAGVLAPRAGYLP